MCNTVCPGLVHTKLVENDYTLKKMAPHNPSMEAIRKIMTDANPLPMSYYQPVDIARVVLLFAGNAMAQVTGEVFDISAGSTARGVA